MSLVEVQETDKDLQDTGLTDPFQPAEQPAVLVDVGENLLLIPEPTPSDQVPAASHAAPLPPSQQTVPVTVHQEEPDEADIPQPLAEELTSKFSFHFFNK